MPHRLPSRTSSEPAIVALPDADQTPEQLAGLAPVARPGSPFARRLAADLGQEHPIEMPDLEQVRAAHKAALAETLPKGA